MRLFINAGHSIEEHGAVYGVHSEGEITMRLRDVLVYELANRGFDVLTVPDSLKLVGSIEWVNRYANKYEDVAVSVHFNTSTIPQAGGTEVFYFIKEDTKEMASLVSKEIARSLGIRNRGAKPDTLSFPGSLGWLRNTKCRALLIEVCFLSNEGDMGKYDHQIATQGITTALAYLINNKEEIIQLRKKVVTLQEKVMELLWLLIAMIKGRMKKI